MPKNLFYESFFTIQCTLRNKIRATILANTFATRYRFIDEEFAETVAKFLKFNHNA